MSLRQRSYLREWQLWMHPYPTMVKNRVRRLNPSKVPYGRMFGDGGELVKLKDLFEARRKQTPPQLKRCVRAVAKEYGNDTSKAFAICTAQLQKHGYLKQGTNRPTKKGAKAGRSKAAEKDHVAKIKEYEDMLKMNRKTEDDNDPGEFGMDARTRKRLKVKKMIPRKGKTKVDKPFRNRMPYNLANIDHTLAGE